MLPRTAANFSDVGHERIAIFRATLCHSPYLLS
jgi:hypothetical protein